jgi:hypothetical protein
MILVSDRVGFYFVRYTSLRVVMVREDPSYSEYSVAVRILFTEEASGILYSSVIVLCKNGCERSSATVGRNTGSLKYD